MISKRTSYILRSLIELCAALLIFAGCSFRTVLPSATGTIKVDVSLADEFALTVARQAVLQSNDRAAVPFGFPTEDSTKFVFAGAVHADGSLDSSMLREGVCTYDTSTGIVSIELPFPIANVARTKLTIYAFPHGTTISSSTNLDTALLVGECAVTVPANSVTATISDNTLIKMKPNTANTSASGTVNLSIKIPKVYFLSADDLTLTWAASSDGNTREYTVSGDITASSPCVTFSLLKTEGNISSAVFAWSETINIFPGLVTNKWTSSGVGEVSDDGRTKTISEITIASTFYVRGEPASGQTSWFETFGSAAGDDDTTGTGSLAKPFATVQKAIDRVLAVNGGAADKSYTIFVDGNFKADATDTAPMADFSGFTNGCSIAVKGLSSENKATLDGNNTVAGIVAGTTNGTNYNTANINLSLENLIIQKCYSAHGAGVLLATEEETNNHTITNCVIEGNSATAAASSNKGDGGGIYNYSKTLTITNCIIRRNTAECSGGGISHKTGTLTINGGEISKNIASNGIGGGGIYIEKDTVNVSDVTLTDNEANKSSSYGGGILNNLGILTISGGAISGNKSFRGGAIGTYNIRGSKTAITDCIISGNTATNCGGAIFTNTGSTATITGCIISGNKVTGSSGNGNAIYHSGTALNLSGSTQIESTGSDANDVYLYNSSTITITGSLTPPDSSKPVAIITPSSYSVGTQVLNAVSGDGSNSTANAQLLSENAGKFAVTPQVKADGSITSWAIDNAGKLKLDISAVIYLSNSGDDSRNGASADTPVKTFKRACDLLSYSAANPTIILCNSYTITATDAPCFDFSGKFGSGSTKKVMVQRGSGWQGKMLDTGSCTGITLKNIVIDGNNAATPSNSTDKGNTSYPLLYINSAATVTLGDNAVLQNDKDRAVHNAGKFIIDGGLITGIETAYGNYGAVRNNEATSEFTLKKGKIENTKGSAIYNKGKVKIEGGEITGNNADNGGAIYNSSEGTVEITGGTISGNSAKNGGAIHISSGTVTISGGTITNNTITDSSGFGEAVNIDKNTSTLIISGSPKIDCTSETGNSIYINTGANPITISGALTLPDGASAIARINLASYALNQVVLQADGTNLTELTNDICKMFILNAIGDTKNIHPDYGIGLSGDKKKGVLTRIAASGIASLPDDKMNFTLRVKPNGAVNSIPYNSSYVACAGDKFSFSVENANGDAIPSDATYKIAMMKNGVVLGSYTKTSTGSIPEIEVPEKFANINMTLDIYMSVTVTVGGVTTTFDDTVSVKTMKEAVVTAADFADYFDALVSAKVPDIYVTVDVANGTDLNDKIAKKIKADAINNSSDIKSINLKISGSITEISADDTFKDCKKLVSVTIPSSITKIANWVFQNCIALKYVYIPNSITQFGNGVFNGCSSLEEITIPSSVTNFGCSFFKGCTSLKTITFTATAVPEFYTGFDISFDGVPATCVVKVPKTSLSAYEIALRAMDDSTRGVGFLGAIVGY